MKVMGDIKNKLTWRKLSKRNDKFFFGTTIYFLVQRNDKLHSQQLKIIYK
jgi:hypothetical protein